MCLIFVTFSSFPIGVSVIFFAIGVLTGLQFIVFAAKWIGRYTVTGVRAGRESGAVELQDMRGR